ncbi:unnamed protein product, partial [Chrysoparadoxa australica]
GFPRHADGSESLAKQGGRIQPGDLLVAANGVKIEGSPFHDAVRLLQRQTFPLVLSFKRLPSHL